jgi:hypothetical protein
MFERAHISYHAELFSITPFEAVFGFAEKLKLKNGFSDSLVCGSR